MDFLKNVVSLSPLVVSPAQNVESDKAALEYFSNLASTAKETAFAHACSSVLAGQSSESDDLEDVGLWLGTGQYDKEHANNVLRVLGLGDKFHFVPLMESGLPATFEFGGDGPLVDALGQLADKYCVRVSVPEASTVVFVLVGRCQSGWGGLVGAGVWSDGLSDY